jgi:hypothetical protein
VLDVIRRLRRWAYTGLHGVTLHKTVLFIVTTVSTSDPTQLSLSSHICCIGILNTRKSFLSRADILDLFMKPRDKIPDSINEISEIGNTKTITLNLTHHFMKVHGRVETELRAVLASTQDEDEWSVSRPCWFTLLRGKSPRYQLNRRPGGPRSRSGRCGR